MNSQFLSLGWLKEGLGKKTVISCAFGQLLEVTLLGVNEEDSSAKFKGHSL